MILRMVMEEVQTALIFDSECWVIRRKYSQLKFTCIRFEFFFVGWEGGAYSDYGLVGFDTM